MRSFAPCSPWGRGWVDLACLLVLRSLRLHTPRAFDSQIVGKHEREFNGFDDKFISLYARGMSTRNIRDHLAEIYGVDVSAELVSRVTDAVVDEVRTWQSRPLERVYLVVYLDALAPGSFDAR